MSNLTQRIITAIIGIALMLSLILWNEYSFAALFLLIALLSLSEFYNLLRQGGMNPQKWLGMFIGICLYLPFITFFLLPGGDGISGVIKDSSSVLFLSLIPLIFLLFMLELYRKSEQPFANIAFTLLGVIYIVLPLALLSYIGTSNDPNGFFSRTFHPDIVVHYLFIIWIYDIGAYFAGKYFGKRKLFERISPKKTWEGVVGGVVCAFLLAHFIAMYSVNLTRMDWFFITLIIVVTGTFGDLAESMFKRSIHIKDSGSVLPGHGGFLDRFDSVFLSAPFVFTYLAVAHG